MLQIIGNFPRDPARAGSHPTHSSIGSPCQITPTTSLALLVNAKEMIIEPLYRLEWSEAEYSYVPTADVVGYCAMGTDGSVLGTGETKEEARDTALQRLWPTQESM